MKTLLLVGCGHMGRAMLMPWLSPRIADLIYVVDPNLDDDTPHGAVTVPAAHELPDGLAPDAVVIALRPQALEQVLPDYAKYSSSLFLTIAAGKPLALYGEILGPSARVVRAMPNLAARVREAAVLLVAGRNATGPDKALAEYLIAPVGRSFWLPDEGLIDAGTALSGCGPAYFWMLADVLAESAARLGLSPALARDLARQTLLGSALCCKDDPASLRTLYQNVAVKGGMTEAAIGTLKHDAALEKLMSRALQAAVARARELAGGA